MDDLERLAHWATPLLQRLSSAQRRTLAREIARDLRADNAANIRARHGPQGETWEPRKNPLRKQRGRIRRASAGEAMFAKLRQAKYLRMQSSPSAAVVAFMGRAERIARVHHLGLRDKVKEGGPDYTYPARPLLGFGRAFIERLRERIVAHLAGQ